MARGQLTFRQRDVQAAVRAVVAAGCAVARIEVDRDGKIVIITDTDKKVPPAGPSKNEWDAV